MILYYTLENNTNIPVNEEKITRKEAIIKVGKYAAFTAAAMMVILSPLDAAAKKSPKPPRLKRPVKKPLAP